MTEQQQAQTQLDSIESAVKAHLSKEALMRFGTIKAANPEKAQRLSLILAQLIQGGRVQGPITDEQLKGILIRLEPPKRDFKITRK